MLVCQIITQLGDGVNDLDGSGGNFEHTLQFGSQVVEPDPQLIYYSSATRAAVFTEQFPLPVGGTVYAKIKSPNAADTAVWVRSCIYEVGVESIRDELALIISRLGTTVVSTPQSGTGGGVYPTSDGSGTGVYPGAC